MSKLVSATVFKATCRRVIEQMNRDREPVVVTKRGRPVAIVSPVPAESDIKPVCGAMQGSVLGYDDPFGPAADPEDWRPADGTRPADDHADTG